ncbi:MAG: GyrI-like domain-containing protein [Planctomycetes bacterium]|nr:GyrI-like domain-containing protein [Planctomycetota bacterium]
MKRVTREAYEERMLRVLVHIQGNLDEELALEELARVAFFSPYHFHRVFRGMVGESVKEHIRRLRLQRAAQRLKQTRLAVVRIALDAGYETHESFTRAFKTMFGEAPSRFRASRRPFPPLKIRSSFRKGKKMEVQIKAIRPKRVAFVRHGGPYSECGKAWDRLLAFVGMQGLLGADTEFIGVCYDDPEVTPRDKVRYDACVTVSEDFRPQGDVGVQLLDGGEYAVTMHQGPYDKLGETYVRLCGRWAPTSGREIRSAPSLEFYWNDPHGTEPGDLLTEIYLPIERK